MGLLEYTSNEMFSSTELVKKSEMIFEKLNNNEIDKAIILRDGKPSFMLYDFKEYELLIKDYLQIQDELKELKSSETKKEIYKEPKIKEKTELTKQTNDLSQLDELDSDELTKALAQIDNLDLTFNKKKVTKKSESLKEFWD